MSFSSESVSLGHPDAVAAYIADSFVRDYLAGDPKSHCGVEVLVTGDAVMVGGEVKSATKVNVEEVVHRALAEIGYDKDEYGIQNSKLSIYNYLHQQSPDIAQGVEHLSDGKASAGDQGMVGGGATTCKEFNYLPQAYYLSCQLQRALWKKHQESPEKFYPDSKCQITTNDYGEVIAIVASASNAANLSIEEVRKELREVVDKFVADNHVKLAKDVQYFLNYTGRFVQCGPLADSGVNGRKLVADSYGGYFPIMGGAQTGKDPTKVDRSGAYMARYLAKAIARYLGEAHKDQYFDVFVQAGYCIGYEHPVSCQVKITDGAGSAVYKSFSTKLAELFVSEGWFDVQTMIDAFDLTHYDLRPTVAFGMFTDPKYPWEKEADSNLSALLVRADSESDRCFPK